MARQPPNGWNTENRRPTISLPFQHPQDRENEAFEPQDLDVSIPDYLESMEEMLRKKESRWIFTPSFNRWRPGRQQALLDRNAALPNPRPGLDVGDRSSEEADMMSTSNCTAQSVVAVGMFSQECDRGASSGILFNNADGHASRSSNKDTPPGAQGPYESKLEHRLSLCYPTLTRCPQSK